MSVFVLRGVLEPHVWYVGGRVCRKPVQQFVVSVFHVGGRVF
jgi:hypothetical protein